MRAFSYAWSLPVTRQRWQAHHLIRCSRKTHDTRKPRGSIFYGTEVIGDRSFTLREQGFWTFCSCDLDLDPIIRSFIIYTVSQKKLTAKCQFEESSNVYGIQYENL